MKYPLYILGFIWCLPATILVWIFYIFPLILFRQIRFVKFEDSFFPVFQLINNDSWYTRAWRDWAGWSGPWVIIVKDLPKEDSAEYKRWLRTLLHELRHCIQQLILGPLFYIIYILDSIFIWIFIKSKHAYLDNVFERDARDYAGQQVNIPKDEWMHGPDDRWPWW